MPPAHLAIVWSRRLFAAIVLAISEGAMAHGVSLDVHFPFPEGTVFHRSFMQSWAAKVEKDSGGRMRLHLHAGASDRDSLLYERVLEGAFDIVWTAISPSTDRFPLLFRIQGAIGTFTGEESASRALWDAVRLNDVLDRDFDGVHVLAIHYYWPAPRADGAAVTRNIGVLAMSSGSFRALADDLKAVLDANGGEDIGAWLARVLERLDASGPIGSIPARDD
jgi:hypothetical protein